MDNKQLRTRLNLLTTNREALHLLKLRTSLHGLRLFVVATAIPPVKSLYLLGYAFAIRVIAWRLKRVPGIYTVYLRRGCARGEILPGLSDVDIGLVGEKEGCDQAWKIHRKWAVWIPVLDFSCDPYRVDRLEALNAQDLVVHFRFYEGRTGWKLLHGTDYIKQLPPATPGVLSWSLYLEMGKWWTFVASKVLPEPRSAWERLESRALCYKMVAETARMLCALQKGTLYPRRREALEKAQSLFPPEGQAMAQRLLKHERTRFLHRDDTLQEDMIHFLLQTLDRWHGEMEELPKMEARQHLTLRIDAPAHEWMLPPTQKQTLLSLVEGVQKEWEGFRGAVMVPSALYHPGEVQLLLCVDPNCLPTQAQLTSFVERAVVLRNDFPRPFYIALQMNHFAASLFSPSMETRIYGRTYLSPPLCPEVYPLALRPEALLLGTPCLPQKPFAWTEYQEWTFLRWRNQIMRISIDLIWSDQAEKLHESDFLKYWWRFLQLVAIERSVYRGEEVVFPLTLPAILRALEREGVAFPTELLPLQEAYQNLLSGCSQEITAFRPAALAFLQSLL